MTRLNKTTMRTYKVKLQFESREVYDFWVERLCTVRDCYNYASKIVYDENVPLNRKAVQARLYREMRDTFPSLPAQVCVSVRDAVIASYRAIKSNNRDRNKKTIKEIIEHPATMKNAALQLDKKLFSCLTQESFKISNGNKNHRSIVNFLTYPKFREMASMYKMCCPKLQFHERTGVIFACIPFLDIAITPHGDECMGIDLGCRRLATLSTGKAFADKKYLANRRKIRHNKRKLQAHKKKSHSARRKWNMLRRKEMNVSKQMCHTLANQILAEKATVLVMEDLSNIKQGTVKTAEGFKRTSHNRRLGQVPFYQLKQILTYKALLAGKRVETVDPHNTSQEDCRTGNSEGCVRRGCRFYTADGHVFDADWNAAINICNRYHHPASFSLPLDGRLDLVGRLPSTGRSSDGLHGPSGKPTPLAGVGS